MIYFRSIYRLTLVAIESSGTGQNVLGAAGRVSRERVSHQLLSPGQAWVVQFSATSGSTCFITGFGTYLKINV